MLIENLHLAATAKKQNPERIICLLKLYIYLML